MFSTATVLSTQDEIPRRARFSVCVCVREIHVLDLTVSLESSGTRCVLLTVAETLGSPGTARMCNERETLL